MKQDKYEIYDYWSKLTNDGTSLWEGLFNNEPIKRESIFIAPTILNSYKNQKESGFAVYPSAKSVLGFLIYVYLPTAFFSVFEYYDYNYMISDDLADFFREQKINHPDKIETIRKMESFYEELSTFWSYEEEIVLDKLIQWTEAFNEEWLNMSGIALSFTIFTSPMHLVNEVVKIYEEDLDIKMLEDDLGINKQEFFDLANDEIYTNEFMRRRFTDILTNRLNVTF